MLRYWLFGDVWLTRVWMKMSQMYYNNLKCWKYNLLVFHVNEIFLFFLDIINVIICFHSELRDYLLHMETTGLAAVQGYEECYFCLEMWAAEFPRNVNDKQMVHFQIKSNSLALRGWVYFCNVCSVMFYSVWHDLIKYLVMLLSSFSIIRCIKRKANFPYNPIFFN